MERSSFKKSLLLELYLKALINTPYVYIKDKTNIRSHRNTLYSLEVLLLNIKHNSNIFSGYKKENEEEFIKSNIEVFNAYEDYNNLITEIKTPDLNYKEVITNLASLLEEEKEIEDISYEDMLERAHNFYNSIPNKEIKNAFNSVYKEKDKNISVKEGSSYSLLFPTIDYSLIILGKEDESYRNMLYDLIHEYGHAIQTKINRNLTFYSYHYEPAELMPVFFTMLSTLWFKDSVENNIEKNILQMQTSLFIDNIKHTKEIKNNGYDYFKEKYNDAIIDNYHDKSSLEIYSYLIPILTSYELLIMYKQDPEKTLYILKELIMNKKNYLESLTENNIHLGKSTNEAIKILKK